MYMRTIITGCLVVCSAKSGCLGEIGDCFLWVKTGVKHSWSGVIVLSISCVWFKLQCNFYCFQMSSSNHLSICKAFKIIKIYLQLFHLNTWQITRKLPD